MLRILLVEDSADDVDLLRFALEDAGVPHELRRVASEAALRPALEDFEPDVAVSDRFLPGYCGLRALALLHELRPRLPLVLLSGVECDAVLPPTATMFQKSELPRLSALLSNLHARP